MVPPGPLADDLTSAEAKLLDRDAGSDIGRTLGALLELGKPGVGGLVIVTTLCGALTAPGPSGFVHLLLTLIGTSCVVAAANGLNMVLERDTDRLMRRTRGRPLPTGRV